MSICEPKKSEIARADNRAEFPNAAEIMDLFRAQFDVDQVKLLHAEESGKTIGKMLPEPLKFKTVSQWLKGSELIKAELARRAVKPMLPSINGFMRGRR